MEFDETTFGTIYANEYDAQHDPGTTEESVELIANLAGGMRLLEFAIGTGRMALPLAAKGFDVSGIEGSPEMIEILRSKPGGADIHVEQGDMSTTRIDGAFDFAFLVFNTLFNLKTQDAQVKCFQNAAQHLRPGGRFLIETFVPDPDRFGAAKSARTLDVSSNAAELELSQHDRATQRVDFQRVRFSASGVKLFPLQMRYALPPEIDLMARLAGLTLEHRWGGWNREPYTGDSKMHVSVYRMPG